MKIIPINNTQNNYYKFTGATVPYYKITPPQDKGSENNKDSNQIPEWGRKGILALLIFLAIENDPTVQNYIKPDEIKREEKAKAEYFEDVRRLGKENEYAPAMYHLNRLVDVDDVNIRSYGRNIYKLEINLDKEKFETQITISPLGNNTISGIIKTTNGELTHYKAIFSEKNPDEFEIRMRNKNHDKYIFGRTPKGEFYRIENNKKIILNKKNVQKYQKSIENLPNFEDTQDLEFFTNKNDMWRKLNLLLLAFLLFNEMAHDNSKRKNDKD